VRRAPLIAAGLLAVSCHRERTITFKAGGSASSGVHYQLGDEDVNLGETPLPWSLTVKAKVSSARIDVWKPRGPAAWCEVWIDGQLCDREDEGRWCSCYRSNRGDSWSGWINGDQHRATRIR